MDIGELKKMLKKSAAVLILENGDPSLVVVDYKTYKELLGDSEPTPVEDKDLPLASAAPLSSESELLERINKDILALKEQIEEDEKSLNQ